MSEIRYGLPVARVPAPDFDLALTLASGQVFHWKALGSGWSGALGDRVVYLEQCGDELIVAPADAALEVAHYLALDHSLEAVRASFPAADSALREAAEACRGLRLLRQPCWECLATFITSSMKQVAHIRQISLQLRERYGERLESGELTAFAYPTPERFAGLTEADLRACALGYRAPNLLATARALAQRETDLAAIAKLNRAAAEGALRALPGVGPKVANCVLLFAFGHLDAFPIDVWIERALRAAYFPRRRPSAVRLQQFVDSHFGTFGGYAQQYLFHHARMTGLGRSSPRRSTRQKRSSP